jgi:hypothetical protein
MKRIECSDGQRYESATAMGIVAQMRDSQWSDLPNKQGYMVEVQERIAESVGVTVRVDTASHFLRDLETAGVLRITEWDDDPEFDAPVEETPETTVPSVKPDAQEEWDQLEVDDGE